MRDGRLFGEFPYLREGEVYLDWTGAAQPPASLLRWRHDYEMNTLLGNPHSPHRASVRATEDVENARRAVLRYFQASEDEYEVVFTANATAAMLLLRNFKWAGGELLLTADNHNSMNGLRMIATEGGAAVRYAPLNCDLSLDQGALADLLTRPVGSGPRIFGMPAKSNYSGHRHDLNWVGFAQQRGWRVLLDAAAFMANNRLNLREIKPDFVPISFYKMFGIPDGLGCMLVRKDAFDDMHKRWFSGGSIIIVSVADPGFHVSEPPGHALYEDGTISFRSIPVVTQGLKFLNDLGDTSHHANGLGSRLHRALSGMSVRDARPIVHSPPGTDIVMFSVEKYGRIIPPWEFEKAANEVGIMLRLGCVCNPGANERNLGYGIDFRSLQSLQSSREDLTVWKLQEASGNQAVGALRASFGYMNTDPDVEALVGHTSHFLQNYRS